MKKQEHLPVYGVGPICVYIMAGFLIAGLVLDYKGQIDGGKTEDYGLIMRISGIILIFAGIFIWVRAVLIDKVGKEILENHLLTTGIYGNVRNPVYSGIAIGLTGIALLTANLYLLVLPVIFWLDITLLMKCTEEKWLKKRYGEEYEKYCKNVNRCIPWFSKKQ